MRAMIPITVLSSDRLYLSLAEASRLADQLRQELGCRTTAQAGKPVVVADIPLSPVEAWELVDKLDASLMDEEIDWATEGF